MTHEPAKPVRYMSYARNSTSYRSIDLTTLQLVLVARAVKGWQPAWRQTATIVEWNRPEDKLPCCFFCKSL